MVECNAMEQMMKAIIEYRCIHIEDFCEDNGLDIDQVLDIVESNIVALGDKHEIILETYTLVEMLQENIDELITYCDKLVDDDVYSVLIPRLVSEVT